MDSQGFQHLRNGVRQSRKDLHSFREAEIAGLRQLVGPHYGENGSDMSEPINMLNLGVSTLLGKLAAKEPQVLCTTQSEALRSSATDVSLAINEHLIRTGFGEEWRIAVMGALFSMGIMKVGVDVEFTSSIDDEEFDVTAPFASAVLFSDWVHDTTAKRWRRDSIQFAGNRYEVAIEDLEGLDGIDQQVLDGLHHRAEMRLFDDNEETPQELAHSRGMWTDETFRPKTTLWDIWVPSLGSVVTFADDYGTKPLREMTWTGPENGPFHIFGFNPVLNNIMPLAPVANWLDTHDLLNRIFNKLGRQVNRQKTVTYASPAAKVDGETVRTSEDGDTILVTNPNGIKEVRFGGPDQQSLGFGGYMRDLMSYTMGNLDTMAGLGSQADTATQEKILSESNNAGVQDMQGKAVHALRGIIRDYGYWLYNDPAIQMDLQQRIEGTDITVDTSWPMQTNEFGELVDAREGDFDMYQFDIEPYSLQDQSPSERFNKLRAIWNQEIMPLAQMGQVQPDVQKYLGLLARYGDMPEIDEIANLMVSVEEQQQPQEQASVAKPESEKRYIHESRNSGMGREGAERSMMNMAMAGTGGGQGQQQSVS